MLEQLIRPIRAEIQAVQTDISTIAGKLLHLPTPTELGVGIYVNHNLLVGGASIKISEGDQELDMNFNISPYYQNVDFLTVWVYFHEKGISVGRRRNVTPISTNDTTYHEYTVEHPLKLYLVEGVDYSFVAGRKRNNVFVDGWPKEREIPSWRISVPSIETDQMTKFSYQELLPTKARLLLFD